MRQLKARAKRGWTLIRRHVREEAMKKKNKSSMQWSMLQHTMKQMKNMDSAREDLYRKYLNPRNPRSWAEGLTSIPPNFFTKRGVHLQSRDDDTHSVATTKSLKHPLMSSTRDSFNHHLVSQSRDHLKSSTTRSLHSFPTRRVTQRAV